jgi:diguanylate cyclase (GGDEF)-like protein
MSHVANATSFTRHVWYTQIILALLVCVFLAYTASEKALDATNERRLSSFLLADELRQSSDDLTRMARLYVVNGDERLQRYYQDILDIRDGRKPRPEKYESIYWEQVIATGEPPRPDSEQTVALLTLMRQAGFTDQEFEALTLANVLSDKLAQTEWNAMRLRQTRGSGAATNHAQALGMLHDAAYLDAKAAIFRPIDHVYTLMTERTNRAVDQAKRNALVLRVIFIALGLALILMLYRMSRTLRAIMGGSVDEVHAKITRIGKWDFSRLPQVSNAEPGSVLAHLAETQAKLRRMSDEREQTKIELLHSEKCLKEAQRLAQLGNWEFDLETRNLLWSDEIYRIFEVDPETFTPSLESFMAAAHPQDREQIAKAYAHSVSSKTPCEMTHRLQMKDGRIKYVLERYENFCDQRGKPLRSVGTVQDITASKLDELALKRVNRDLRLLSDCNMALVHAEDEHVLIAEISRLCVENGGYLMAWVGYAEHDEACTVLPVAQSGYENGYLDGLTISWADVDHGQGAVGTAIRTGQPSIIQNVQTDSRMAPWRASAIQRGYQSSVALPLICDAQVLGALNLYASEANAFDPNELRLLMELASDLAFGIVTLRSRAEHAAAKLKLDFLAHFDPLTHLPNRLLLHDRFEHAVLLAQSENTTVSLLYLDLDRFRQINDSQGYATGDQVIVLAVERLQQCIPTSATISRISGDEFVVLLTGHYDVAGIAVLANSIRDAFFEPVKIVGNALDISFSIGIGLFPNDGEDFNTLLKNAHTAVESAKKAGRDTYCFFSHNMNAGLAEQIRLTGALTNAVRNHEFRLHYQPQIDIRSGKIIGTEALVRWQHPDEGLVPPGKFIALAERSGHIIQIGEWVLNEACRQARIWLDQYPTPLVVAVNLSSLQLKRGNVLEMVSTALAASGLPPDRLELELTESILLEDVDATIKTLRGLKSMGVKLSIDDFGTGYSSLSYLKRLAVDKIKIDQSFVRDLLTDADGASIVKAIIQLGHSLQLTVIAEGVELDAQLAFLSESGCDEVQGYLYSRPVPAEQFTQLLDIELAKPHVNSTLISNLG